MHFAHCRRINKPNASTIDSIPEEHRAFREWLKSLDMTALVEASPVGGRQLASSTATGNNVTVDAPPDLVIVRGLWTALRGSRVVAQRNTSFVNLCAGDEVRTALQNFLVKEVLYGRGDVPQGWLVGWLVVVVVVLLLLLLLLLLMVVSFGGWLRGRRVDGW